ncbi:MAG: hypothetical protein U5N55_13655 [Cypionkella sp.]|nr:hypothetical protein [Cypionkella sp.]
MNLAFTQIAHRAGLAGAMALALSLWHVGPVLAQDFAFNRVVVQGNSNVDAASIVKFAQIQQGAGLTAAQLKDALQRVSEFGSV